METPQRWTRATVHPDMWVNPEDDPRNSEGVSPDGELATLRDYTHAYRWTLVMKCQGLDAEQLARRSVPPSTLSLLGLVRHLAEAERDWRNWITPDPEPRLWGGGQAAFEGATADDAVVVDAFSALETEQQATDQALLGHDLAVRLGEQQIAVREVWLHRIEEYARHCGHADLLRECLDGRVGQ